MAEEEAEVEGEDGAPSALADERASISERMSACITLTYAEEEVQRERERSSAAEMVYAGGSDTRGSALGSDGSVVSSEPLLTADYGVGSTANANDSDDENEGERVWGPRMSSFLRFVKRKDSVERRRRPRPPPSSNSNGETGAGRYATAAGVADATYEKDKEATAKRSVDSVQRQWLSRRRGWQVSRNVWMTIGQMTLISAVMATLPLIVPMGRDQFKGDSKDMSVGGFTGFHLVYAIVGMPLMIFTNVTVFPMLNPWFVYGVVPAVAVGSAAVVYMVSYCEYSMPPPAGFSLIAVHVPIVMLLLMALYKSSQLEKRRHELESDRARLSDISAAGMRTTTQRSMVSTSSSVRSHGGDSSGENEGIRRVRVLREVLAPVSVNTPPPAAASAGAGGGGGRTGVSTEPWEPPPLSADNATGNGNRNGNGNGNGNGEVAGDVGGYGSGASGVRASASSNATGGSGGSGKFNMGDHVRMVAARNAVEEPLLLGDGLSDSRLSALTMSPYYAHYEVESVLGIDKDLQGAVIGNAYALWGLLVALSATLSLFYICLVGVTAEFNAVGDDSPAPIFLLFCFVGHGFRILLKWIGRNIDRRRTHGLAMEVCMEQAAFCFLYVFYRSLFSEIHSYKAFIVIKALSMVGELFLYPIRMSTWYHGFHKRISRSQTWGGRLYRLMTYEVSAELLQQRLSLDYALRFSLIVSTAALYLYTFAILRFGYNSRYFYGYRSLSYDEFNRTIQFTLVSVALELVLFTLTYVHVQRRTRTSVFTPWLALFRNRSGYYWLYILCLGHITTDPIIARLRDSRVAENSC